MLPLLCRGAELSTKGSLVFELPVSPLGVATSTVFGSVAMAGNRVRPEELAGVKQGEGVLRGGGSEQSAVNLNCYSRICEVVSAYVKVNGCVCV